MIGPDTKFINVVIVVILFIYKSEINPDNFLHKLPLHSDIDCLTTLKL
jgi:hypothetical protein